MPAISLFTVGHSTHSLEDFLALLTNHNIEALVDIRRFPGSRKFPHFNQDNLAAALQKAGIDYRWLESLGGRRGKKRGAPSTANLGLRNAGFRNYADYMLTEDFQDGLQELLSITTKKRAAIMCAEALFWRCHRRLVSDWLTANGITVQHIFPDGKV